jgi:glycosyltransferase involved in cell wall biosynthesis
LDTVMLVTPPGASTRLSGTSVLARTLAAHGDAFQYRVLTRPDAPELSGPVSLDRVYRGGSLSRAARMFGRVLTGGGSAIHHYFFAPHPKAVHVVRGAALLARRPTVHTIPSAPASDLNPASLLFADRTVVMSEATALLFASSGAPTPTVIRPGTTVPPEPARRREARQRLESSDVALSWGEAPVLLYPGDLSFSDGALTFIEAAGRIAQTHPTARFALACRAKTPHAAQVLAQVHRRAEQLGISERVHTLGVVADMATLLGAVDLVVMPVDTLYAKIDVPLVLLEAMALGIPAVVSDLPSLAELPVLGAGVMKVPRSDPAALADRLSVLLSDAAALPVLGAAARRMVIDHFDAAAMTAHYERLYREVLHA